MSCLGNSDGFWLSVSLPAKAIRRACWWWCLTLLFSQLCCVIGQINFVIVLLLELRCPLNDSFSSFKLNKCFSQLNILITGYDRMRTFCVVKWSCLQKEPQNKRGKTWLNEVKFVQLCVNKKNSLSFVSQFHSWGSTKKTKKKKKRIFEPTAEQIRQNQQLSVCNEIAQVSKLKMGMIEKEADDASSGQRYWRPGWKGVTTKHGGRLHQRALSASLYLWKCSSTNQILKKQQGWNPILITTRPNSHGLKERLTSHAAHFINETLNSGTHRTGGVDHREVVAIDVRGSQGAEEGGAEQAGRDPLFLREQRWGRGISHQSKVLQVANRTSVTASAARQQCDQLRGRRPPAPLVLDHMAT